MTLIDEILNEKKSELSKIAIIDYTIGISYIAVKTQAGTGLSYAFRNLIPQGCSVSDADYNGMNGFTAAKMALDSDPLKAAMGIAVINSLNKDTETNIAMNDKINFKNKYVAMIGYFRPVAEQIKSIVDKLDIFELKLTENTYPSYYAKRILPKADIVLITGTSLIIHTTDEFLPYINKSAETVFMGPTTPICKTLLKYGHIAGSIVINENGAFKVVRQGGGMKKLKPVVKKIFVEKQKV